MRRRRDVGDYVWRCMLEDAAYRAEGYHELPIMRHRLAPWWPWHPAVFAALGLVLVVLTVAKGCAP